MSETTKSVLLLAAIAFGLALAVVFAPGCSTTVITNGVPNLASVAPGVWRSGQPTAAGWHYLKSLGITNVIKLNTVEEVSDWEASVDRMMVYECPITMQQQLFGPVAGQVVCAVGMISPGCLVHCEHGQDRTGLVIACYRVWKCGWTKADAEKEMLAHGFHKELRGLWEYWEDKIPSQGGIAPGNFHSGDGSSLRGIIGDPSDMPGVSNIYAPALDNKLKGN